MAQQNSGGREWRGFRSLPARERYIVVRAAVLLPAYWLMLRSLGYRRTKAAGARFGLARPTTGETPPTPEQVARLVLAASDHHPFHRTSCLNRSLVLETLLRSYGYSSELIMGVRDNNGHVEAHAWIEVAGIPLLERPDVRQTFAVLQEPRRESAI